MPIVSHFKGMYGDNLIFFKQEHGAYPTVLSRDISMWIWNAAYVFPIGGPGIGAPMMFLNQHYLSQATGDSVFKASLKHTVDSTNAHTALASPIFTVTNVGTDSMIVDTKVKFLQPADGDYRVGILLLQDSIWYQQTGAPGGYCYHMSHLSGPEPKYNTMAVMEFNGADSANYTLANGPIAAGTVFNKSFHYKLDTTQKIKNMRPVVVVWKYDTVHFYNYTTGTDIPLERLIYVNANEKPGLYIGLGTEHMAQPETYTATVYPNPAAGMLHVKLEGVREDPVLHIYDMAGRCILTQQVADGRKVDIGMLNNGLYIYDFRVRGQVIADGKVSVMR